MEENMKEKPLVSIVIPVFNSAKFLKDCIDSLCMQTWTNLEIIAVNDGSTDGSLDILEQYAKADSRLRVVSIENSGVSVARNIGIENAKGKYISFVDSDDQVDETMLEKLALALEIGEYGMAICGIRMTYWHNKKEKTVDNLPGLSTIADKESFEESFPKMFSCKAYLSVWAKLYQLEIIKENYIRFKNGISIGEDMLFNYDYLRCNYRSIIKNEALYSYCVRKEKNGSLTQRFATERLKNNEMLLRESVKFMEELNIKTMFEPIAKYYFVSSLLLLNKYLGNKEKENELIRHILNSDCTGFVCQPYQIRDIELSFYRMAFSRKKIGLIKMAAYFRSVIKNIFR